MFPSSKVKKYLVVRKRQVKVLLVFVDDDGKFSFPQRKGFHHPYCNADKKSCIITAIDYNFKNQLNLNVNILIFFKN